MSTSGGKRVKPSCRGSMRCAKALTGRCLLSGVEGLFVRQSKGTYRDETPFMRWQDES